MGHVLLWAAVVARLPTYSPPSPPQALYPTLPYSPTCSNSILKSFCAAVCGLGSTCDPKLYVRIEAPPWQGVRATMRNIDSGVSFSGASPFRIGQGSESRVQTFGFKGLGFVFPLFSFWGEGWGGGGYLNPEPSTPDPKPYTLNPQSPSPKPKAQADSLGSAPDKCPKSLFFPSTARAPQLFSRHPALTTAPKRLTDVAADRDSTGNSWFSFFFFLCVCVCVFFFFVCVCVCVCVLCGRLFFGFV